MKGKIFLVEDEESVRLMYEEALKQRNYEVDSVDDGEKALDKLTKNKVNYDLILLDIMLPKIDGLEVLKRIKAETSPSKEIPVFLLTNLATENLIKETLNIGGTQYLIKSNFLPKQIVDEIETFLEENKKLKNK